jgi:outer membrane immunogenic protein
MRHIRIHLLTACAALGLASLQAASAADLPGRMMPPPMPSPIPAPYYMPFFSWAGPYIGANLGYGWGKSDGRITINGIGSGPISGESNGFLGGLQAGYNAQLGSFVVGLETDFQLSMIKGDVTGSPGTARLTGESKEPWFGTFRGRFGYASERWLMYLTGGALYGEAQRSGTVSGNGSFDTSASYWTWTFGGGAETSVGDRWTVKLEYLYVGTPSDVPSPPHTSATSGDVTSHIMRTGLNYRF